MSTTDVRRVMSDLVLPDEILDAVGPAFAQQRSVFLYGPPGTGKTSIAERMTRLYGDVIVIPYAVEVDGQIITVFDPTLHKALPRQPQGIDARWVVCERPFVITGGELELSMLQTRRDPMSGVYNAPLQMKANNGVLLIDDFGRQLVPPGALLNRWIVPLERRVDFLSLDHGTKFAIPFQVLVVFSTNFPRASSGPGVLPPHPEQDLRRRRQPVGVRRGVATRHHGLRPHRRPPTSSTPCGSCASPTSARSCAAATRGTSPRSPATSSATRASRCT